MFHLDRAPEGLHGQAPATPAASGPARPAAQLRREQPARANPLGGGLRDERGELLGDERRGHHRDRGGVAADILRALQEQGGRVPRRLRRGGGAAGWGGRGGGGGGGHVRRP